MGQALMMRQKKRGEGQTKGGDIKEKKTGKEKLLFLQRESNGQNAAFMGQIPVI